jgi:hypothetical protein
MYTLLRSMTVLEFLVTQGPAIIISLVIATLFYSGMHNFLWECVAFLATWFVVDFVISQGRRLLRK